MKLKKLALISLSIIFGYAFNTHAKNLIKNDINLLDKKEIKIALSEGEIANRDFQDVIKIKKLLNYLRNGGIYCLF